MPVIGSTPRTHVAEKPSFFSRVAQKASSLINFSSFQKKPVQEKSLKTVEARKPVNPNQPLIGKEIEPAVKAVLGVVQDVKQAMVKAFTPRFDAKDLYGASGKPKGSDINQDSIGDCYFVATLGAMADRQPKRIQDAIQYNAKTGNFTVTLHEKYDSNGWLPGGDKTREVKIEVSQAEIEDNLKRHGGSTVDNNKGTDAPIWPAVMETAYAKMHDRDPANGLDQGYKEITGGWAKDAMFALTGDSGEVFKVKNSNKDALDKAYDHLKQALDNNQPVTLSTDPEKKHTIFLSSTLLVPIPISVPGKQDGLVDNHVYSLEGIERDKNGEVVLKLRNPWANNNNVKENQDTPNAVIEVKLKDLVETQGLESLNIGPQAK